MQSLPERIGLIALVGVSLLFHLATIRSQCLFVDEVSEVLNARGTLAEAAMHPDSMPPTFTLLVRGWGSLFGEGKGVRWISALASLAAIVIVWRIGRRLGAACGLDPAVVGLASAALFAANPMQLYYAQLIRGYALTTLTAALAIAAFLRAMEFDRRGDWLLFSLAGAIGVWCHYYFVVLLVVLLGALVWRRQRVGAPPALAAGLIVLASLPLLPFLQQDFGYQHDLREPRPLSAEALAYTGLSFFSGYTLGPSKSELHQLSGAEAAKAAAPWGAAVALCVLPLLATAAPRVRHAGWLAPIVMWTFGPTALIGLIGAAAGLTFNPRFVAWCVVPLSMWLGVGVVAGLAPGPESGRTARRLTTACLVGLLAVMATAIVQRNASPRYQNENLEAAVDWLIDNAPANEPVFVVADYFSPQLRFLAELRGANLPTYELPRPGLVDRVVESPEAAEEGATRLREIVGNAGDFWLVESRAFHTDPHGYLLEAVGDAADLEIEAEFVGVRVLKGQLR